MKLINKLNNRLARKHSKAGFSLVELLVVIAVIGILAAIAIPALSNVFESSSKAKAKRNAQNIASTYAAARAAGASTGALGVSGSGLTDATATAAVVQALATANSGNGVTGQGSFAATYFKISSLDSTQLGYADDYLDWNDTAKTLTYNGTAED